MLSQDLHVQGNWLFRHRSYLPLLLAIFVVLALIQKMPLDDYPTIQKIYNGFCILISVIGLWVRIITIGQVPKRTSGRNTRSQIADTLNTTGIYSMVRHPLYLGNFLMWLGVILYTEHIWFIVFFCVLYALYYERIMLAEEEFLAKKFGKAYEVWSQTTPVFIPKFRSKRKSDLEFSLRNVLKREYSGLLGLAVSFAFVRVVYTLIHTHKVRLSISWLIAVGVCVLIYIVLRTLKRSTRILHVEGR